jgi:GTPase SAR1 family protein
MGLLKNREYQLRIALLGAGTTGKTTLARAVLEEPQPDVPAKDSPSTLVKTLESDEGTLKLVIFDQMSSGIYVPVTYQLKSVECWLLVFDITDAASFETAADLLGTITRRMPEKAKQGLLLGTKCDRHVHRKVDSAEAQALAAVHQIPYLEVSAVEGTAIESILPALSAYAIECSAAALGSPLPLPPPLPATTAKCTIL